MPRRVRGLNRRYNYSFGRARAVFLGNMIFSTIIKVEVIGTPAFFFRVRNSVLSGSFKVYGIIVGPGGCGILKSLRGTGVLSTSELGLVTGLGPNRIPGHQPEFTRGWNPLFPCK